MSDLPRFQFHDDYEAFYRLGPSTRVLLSRRAAKQLFSSLADQGYQLLGFEGGIYSDDGFEARLDSIFSRRFSATNREEAHAINIAGISSIDGDPKEYNAYSVVVRSYRKRVE